MPTIREAVEQAANPQEALLAIADGLDRLLNQQPTADAWGGWEPQPGGRDEYRKPAKPAMDVAVDADGVGEVVFADAPLHVKEARAVLMTETFPLGEALAKQLDPDEAIQAYIAGGPLWLREFDRVLTLQLPANIRQAMVQDVLEYDPVAAAELSRDILKETQATQGVPDYHPAVTGD